MDDPVLSRIVRIIIEAADTDSIILFGSRVTGRAQNDSDYGICVLKSGNEGRIKKAKLLYRSLYGVGVPVNILVETPASYNANRTNLHLIYREIARTGKVMNEKPGNCKIVAERHLHYKILYQLIKRNILKFSIHDDRI